MTQDWDADRYEESGRFVSEEARDLIDLLDPQPGERVLDLGCGTGHLTAELADQGAEVVGLDSAEDMLWEARELHPGIEFVEGDIRKARFDKPFEAVFSNAALHWVTDAEAAVETIDAALRPGGRFVAEFGGAGNCSQVVTAVQEAVADAGYPRPDHPWYFPSIGEYVSLLESRGIQTRFARLFDRPIEMDSGEYGLREWIAMFGDQFFADLSEENQEAVRDRILSDVEDRLREDLWDGESWTIDYVRIRVRASKE